MIKVEHLSAYYGAREVVKDNTFEIESGEVLAVVGRNGSGKSTMLRAIAGDVMTRGRVTIEGGRDLSSMSRRERALRVAFVEQVLPDVEMMVEDYIALGRMPHIGLIGLGLGGEEKAIVERVMAKTGVESLRGRRIDELSGGERQMCAIARALVQETDIVMLDEPTASLDMSNQLMVARMIGEMRKEGKTVICVMHDLNMAMEYCDRLLLMKDGEVKALGRVGESITEEVLAEAMGVGLEIIEVKDRNMRIIVPRK